MEDFYPIIVYPAGNLDRKLVFAYINKDGSAGFSYLGKDDEKHIVKHDDATKKGLYGFDPSRHLLFAFSKSDVVAYDITERRSFYASLLRDPEFCADKPFVRWDMAEASENPDLIAAARKKVEDYEQRGLQAGRRSYLCSFEIIESSCRYFVIISSKKALPAVFV
jgi:uncharacterized CHY-type Zn-finger protein